MTETLARGPLRTDVDTQHEMEAFLSYEAELLDSWQLREWLQLVTEDVRYLVPSTDIPNSESPESEVFIIFDTYAQLVGRVTRLEHPYAHVEQPRSRTRRLITNVRVEEIGTDEYEVKSNFAVYRHRRGTQHVYVGEYRHRLVRSGDGGLRIRERRATLIGDELRPQGKVSFIL